MWCDTPILSSRVANIHLRCYAEMKAIDKATGEFVTSPEEPEARAMTHPAEIDRALARFQAEGSGGQIILHVDRTGTIRKLEIRETIAVRNGSAPCADEEKRVDSR